MRAHTCYKLFCIMHFHLVNKKLKQMKRSNLLLLIDMQNDFCTPEGSLYVRGAG